MPTLRGSAEPKAGQGAASPVLGQPRGSGVRAPEPAGCSAGAGNRGPWPQTLPTHPGGCRALPSDPARGKLGIGEWARPPRGAFGGTHEHRCQAWTPAGLQEEATASAPASYPQGPETDLLHGERESWGLSLRVRLRACPTEGPHRSASAPVPRCQTSWCGSTHHEGKNLGMQALSGRAQDQSFDPARAGGGCHPGR